MVCTSTDGLVFQCIVEGAMADLARLAVFAVISIGGVIVCLLAALVVLGLRR